MKKKTNREDKKLELALTLAVVCFWVQIICAFVGDHNVVAPWSLFIYMFSTLSIMCRAIDLETKLAPLRIFVGVIAMWSIIILIYVGILALRGFL